MRFKKHISLFLAFFLLVSNVGFAFNVHYCGDEIASVSFKSTFVEDDSEANCCGISEEKTHCCKDKVFHFQKKSDHAIVKFFSFHFDYNFIINEYQPIVASEITNFKINTRSIYFCDANGPPLFKLYSQYIFYDKF
jgi:hypothetical protein